MRTIQVRTAADDRLVAGRVLVADRFWYRLKGLLGRESLDPGEGLLLVPCSAIHCRGMRFPIDAVFLDRQQRVTGLRENLIPGEGARVPGARSVLELPAGEIKKLGLKEGISLLFTEIDGKR